MQQLKEITPEEYLSETAQLRFLPTDTAEKYPRRPSELHDLKDASGGMKPTKKQMDNS